MLKSFLLAILLSLFLIIKIHWEEPVPNNIIDDGPKFQIYRDQNGIPHVTAYNKYDLAFAMGFAQAQDRLWTLFFKKKLINGQLSELVGKDGLKSDIYMRNLGFRKVGQMNAKILDDQTRKYAQSYCNGINSYVKKLKMLPMQFYILWVDWQQFTIEDSLTYHAMLSFMLEFDWMYEIARQRLLETVGFELAQKIFPFGQKNLFREVTILSDEELKSINKYKKHTHEDQINILTKHWKQKKMVRGLIHIQKQFQKGMGSNAWVIGGNHTSHGKPILSNDPHLGLLIPSLFYMIEIILLSEDNQVITQSFGVMIDGVPGLSIGVNKNFAWGATASYIDNKDVYYETVKEDQNYNYQYLFENQWHDFKIRQETIKIRGQDDIVEKFYQTHRGPVIKDIFLDYHPKYGYPFPQHFKEHHTISIASSIYRPDNTSLKGLIASALVDKFQDFKQLGYDINGPNIDSVWIDKEGNFGYSSIGRIPKRQIPQMGSFIKDGSSKMYEMGDFLEGTDRPYIINPKKGYLSMANNKFAEDSYEFRSSLHEISTGRSYRIQNIIKSKIVQNHKFTFQDMIEMQADQRDDFLSEAFPGVLKALTTVKKIWQNSITLRYYNLLLEWDYEMSPKSVESSLYHVWEDIFHDTLFLDVNITNEQRINIVHHAFFEIYQLILFEKMGNSTLGEQQNIVCKNKYTQQYPGYHSCIINAGIAFKMLPDRLQKLFKTTQIHEYNWGKIHKNQFKSLPWSQIPLIKNLYGRQTEAGGNSRTINVAILNDKPQSFTAIAGPIFKFITDINRTIFSYDTGETDRVFSPFYDNFLGKNKYVEYYRRNPLKEQVKEWKKIYDSF